jgi:hypothetical protein
MARRPDLRPLLDARKLPEDLSDAWVNIRFPPIVEVSEIVEVSDPAAATRAAAWVRLSQLGPPDAFA